MQHAAKRDVQLAEIQDLRQQVDSRNNEIRNLNSNIDSLKSVNEELKVRGRLLIMRTFRVTYDVKLASDRRDIGRN
jgi:kinesin family protein 5